MPSSCVPRTRRSTTISATRIGRPDGPSRRATNGAAPCNSVLRPPTRSRSAASSTRVSASRSRREPRRRVADARAAMISVPAPAKINLYLHVVGRRPDGYHELDSLVAFADIADTVAAAPAATVSLEIDGPFAAALAGDAAADNLVMRAAGLLAARFGVTAGAA